MRRRTHTVYSRDGGGGLQTPAAGLGYGYVRKANGSYEVHQSKGEEEK